MNFFKRWFGGDGKAKISTDVPSKLAGRDSGKKMTVREQLQQLLSELKALEEPVFEGAKARENNKHLACVAFASALALTSGTQLTGGQRAQIEQMLVDFTREDFAEGLDFQHPWPTRVAILKEMPLLAFRR